MPALQLRSGQAPVGILCSLSLGNSLRLLFRQQANYAQSSANSRSEEPALQPQVVVPLGARCPLSCDDSGTCRSLGNSVYAAGCAWVADGRRFEPIQLVHLGL